MRGAIVHVVVLALLSVAVAVEVARASTDPWVPGIAAAVAIFGFICIAKWCRRATTATRSVSLLVAASLPALALMGASLTASVSALELREIAPLWLITDVVLADQLEVVGLGLRLTSMLLAGAACVGSPDDALRREGAAALLVCAAGFALHAAAPLWGGVWLLAAAPLVLLVRPRGAALVAAAFGGALTLWVLDDHVHLWMLGLRAVDMAPGGGAGPRSLSFARDVAADTGAVRHLEPLALHPGLLLLAWLPAGARHVLRRGRVRLGVVGLALLGGLPALVSVAVTVAALRGQTEGLGELPFTNGAPVAISAEAELGSCTWVPRSGDSLAPMFAIRGCSDVAVVGRGPSLSTLAHRGGRSALPFGFPDVASPSLLYVGIESPGHGGPARAVRRSVAVRQGNDGQLWVSLDGAAPFRLPQGAGLTLATRRDQRAVNALAWVDALASRSITVTLRPMAIEPSPG